MRQDAHTSHWVGSLEFVPSSPQLACEQIMFLAAEGAGRHVHLANAYTVAIADRSEEYRDVLAAPAFNLPDGKPVVWVSHLRGQSPPLIQVRGPQLFLDVFDRGRSQGLRHFLLGSTPQVLELLEQELTTRFPGVAIVGVESPPFRTLSETELEDQDRRIRDSGAQIVWVGLGTPKQDIEARRLAGELSVVAVAIGAAFALTAGSMPESPVWMEKAGLEWLHRVIHEPRRLWRRYLFGNARFIKVALFPPKSRARARARSG